MVEDRRWIFPVTEGGKSCLIDRRVAAGGDGKVGRGFLNCLEPGLQGWLDGFDSSQKGFVGATEEADALEEVVEAEVGRPTEAERGEQISGRKMAR
jgi:hypothetical protein